MTCHPTDDIALVEGPETGLEVGQFFVCLQSQSVELIYTSLLVSTLLAHVNLTAVALEDVIDEVLLVCRLDLTL